MDRLSSAKRFASAAVACVGALFAASAAQARTDVHFSIGVPAPVYVQPAPVYVQPRPVYVQPRPVYVQPHPVYVQPHPVYTQRPQLIHAPQHHYYRGNGWQGRDRQGWRHGPHGDMDRDGVANYRDRDRDGDGVRNRHDRRPDNGWRY